MGIWHGKYKEFNVGHHPPDYNPQVFTWQGIKYLNGNII
jgi:hypothetical protein